MSHSHLADFIIFIFFDFPEQIVIPIAFCYLFGEFYKFFEFLLFGFLMIFLKLNAEV